MNEAYDFKEAVNIIEKNLEIYFLFIGDGSKKDYMINKTKEFNNI
jgi:hypothetical protein